MDAITTLLQHDVGVIHRQGWHVVTVVTPGHRGREHDHSDRERDAECIGEFHLWSMLLELDGWNSEPYAITCEGPNGVCGRLQAAVVRELV